MIQVEVLGSEIVVKFLEGVVPVLDTSALLDEAAAMLLNRIKTRFLAQVSPDGVPWVPSMAARMRERTGRGGGTLYDTGNLFRSIQLFGNGPSMRGIGTDVSYGANHQFGLNGMLRREFMGFSKEDTTVVSGIVREKVRLALEKYHG